MKKQSFNYTDSISLIIEESQNTIKQFVVLIFQSFIQNSYP